MRLRNGPCTQITDDSPETLPGHHKRGVTHPLDQGGSLEGVAPELSILRTNRCDGGEEWTDAGTEHVKVTFAKWMIKRRSEQNPNSPFWPHHLHAPKAATALRMKTQILNVEFEATPGLACDLFSSLLSAYGSQRASWR